jgi:hypothetical protein
MQKDQVYQATDTKLNRLTEFPRSLVRIPQI